MYIGFFTPDKCRSFCCIKICEYLENAIILLQFTIFPLNTDIESSKDYASCVHGNVNSKGWYRIAKSKGHYGNNSCVISLKRSFNNPAPEYQKIQFFGVYTLRKFVSLAAIYGTHIWTKIRETWDETNDYSYIEIYQNVNSGTNIWAISIGDTFSAYGGEYNWKAIPPVQTQETISGVRVLASLDLPENNLA